MGKITIFDFYADWCVPCKGLEAKLIDLMQTNDRIALRKVNIVAWDSAAAKQHLAGVEGIPFVIIRNESGEEFYRGTGLFERIIEVLGSATQE
ncbi:MAG: thioredoxin family protein [Verrucomicrobiae bacterium]|nr:thioredoxin family protein [Verrucomicrobiae bacterium]